MNPNSGENQPQFEVAPPSRGTETAADQGIEKGKVSSPERSPQQVLQASQAATSAALPGQAIAVGDNDDATPDDQSQSGSAVASDSDRIEKVWVDKAKAVVAQTQDDPYEQKNAMSQVKAQYIKKRFNKTIKTDDPVTT